MRTTPVEALDYVASVRRVPRKVLPPGPARDCLLRLARTGYDVRAYQSGGPAGVWCVWFDDLARVRPDRDGRVPVAEWRERWPALLAEMRLTPGDLDAAQIAARVADVEGVDA